MVLALGGVAWAQSTIGPAITQSQTLTNTQLTQVTNFIRDNQDDLLSDDPTLCQRARKRLSDPLESANISLDFRRKYSDQLMGTVGIASQSQNEHIAVNALLLAGHLATPQSVEVLVRALDDQRVPVRYAGLAGLTLTMAQIDRSQPAIHEDLAVELVERVATLVENEESSIVFDGGVRTLVAAATQRQIDAVRRQAQTSIFSSLRYRLKSHQGVVDTQTLTGAIRGIDALQSLLIEDTGNIRNDVATSAAELSGHLLALLGERIGAGDVDDDQTLEMARVRNLVIQGLQLCEATINLVNADYRNGQPLAGQDLGGTFGNGDNAGTVEAINQGYIGPNGVLIRPPFSFAAGTFDR